MNATNHISASAQLVKGRLAEYAQLVKVRLSFLVVFSATMAYLWVANGHISVITVLLVSIGGFLITGAANTLNQIIEKDSDKLMKRTFERPLADERIEVKEALIFALTIGITGLFLLYNVNVLSAVLGATAILIYAAIYTPLKKISRLTVIPGAIAGSIPVVIGCVAASGKLSAEAWMLFTIQFIWQFPHTWAIAWMLDDEYKKAGIEMMPTAGGRDKTSASLILLSTLLTIPIGFVFHYLGLTSMLESCLLAIAGIGFSYFAYKLYLHRTQKAALGVMFGSFAYLPFVLIMLVLVKIFA